MSVNNFQNFYETNFQNFYDAECLLSLPQEMTPLTGRAIYKFNSSNTSRIPLSIRTGQQALGNPTERKKFSQIEFHGKGTVRCRVYVDGVWICDNVATMTETPTKDRRIGLPTGTKGYTLDVEFCGDADIRAMEITYSSMSETS